MTRQTNKTTAGFVEIDVAIGKIFTEALESQQVTKDTGTGSLTPPIPFDGLLTVYNNSYIIGGIADKVARTCNSGIEISDEKTNKDGTEKAPIIEVADKIDYEFLFLCMEILGNAFFEVIRDVKTGKVKKIVNILPGEIKVLVGGE